MPKPFLRSVLPLLVLCGLWATGCRCGPPQTTRQYGELTLVYEVEEGTRADRDATYDFGPVFMGQTLSRRILVQNRGSGALTLFSMEKVEGDAVRIGEGGDDAPVWDVRFVPGTQVAVAEVVEIEVIFIPRQGAEAQVEHGVKLTLRAENAREGEDVATITLLGRAVSGV